MLMQASMRGRERKRGGGCMVCVLRFAGVVVVVGRTATVRTAVMVRLTKLKIAGINNIAGIKTDAAMCSSPPAPTPWSTAAGLFSFACAED
jgi:hypothetical protein